MGRVEDAIKRLETDQYTAPDQVEETYGTSGPTFHRRDIQEQVDDIRTLILAMNNNE